MNHVNGCQCSQCLGQQITDGQWGADFNPNGWGLQHLHCVASPVYNNRANYNTNSKSYYDYLARQTDKFTSTIVPQINRLLRRDITFTETKSIKPTKTGSWTGKPCDCQSTGAGHMAGCACYCFDDVVDVVENVKLSPITKPYTHTGTPDRTLGNAISIEGTDAKDPNAGLFAIDWSAVIGDIINKNNSQDTAITNINNSLTEINNKIDAINKFLTQIYNDLKDSGGYTGTQGDGHFNGHIATGTINLHTLSNGDANYLIRTHTGHSVGDYTGGVQ